MPSLNFCKTAALPILLSLTIAPALAQQVNLLPLQNLGVESATVTGMPLSVRSDLLHGLDGRLYVSSFAGGYDSDSGTGGYGSIAAISLDGKETTVLGSLVGTGGGLGLQSYARLVQGPDGTLYGTTYLGGDQGGGGTVFRVTLDGEISTLYSFGSKSDPKQPYAGLALAGDGNLYGTTLAGGKGGVGVVFKIATDGTGFSVVHDFNRDDGAQPEGALIIGPNGDLYGTTLSGGKDDRGTIYRISTSGTFTSLYSFSALGAFDSASGRAVNDTGTNPRSALLLASDGNLYGTAYQGGKYGYGTVFRITTAGDGFTVIHHFIGSPFEGALPLAGVSEGEPGVFYGTTEQGGHLNAGSAYRVTAGGNFTLLHSFVGGYDDGNTPYATLLPVDGELYGITYSDSVFGGGALFKLVLPDANNDLPVKFTVSPTSIDLGASVTLNWSSPTADTCLASGAWDSSVDAIDTSGSQTQTPAIPGRYTYVLSCTDEDGVRRNAYASLLVNAQQGKPVDGGASGGGAVSVWWLLLAAALLPSRLKKAVANR
jgi:uncharacterized repeat protein (TIGR03803 family)